MCSKIEIIASLEAANLLDASIDLIVTRPLIGSQKLKPMADKKIGIMGLLYIYK